MKTYGLPPETKTYGSPHDLAKDPDVDLVVISTRVDRHALVALPSLRAGKDVFCEWPLEKNLTVVKEMVAAAKEGGGKTFVGAQAPMDPLIRKIKALIQEGRVGRVLSSTFVGATDVGGSDQSQDLAYMTDRSVGGNVLTIAVGHSEKDCAALF